MLPGRLQSASNGTGGRTLSHLAVTSPHSAPRKQQIRLRRDPTHQTWRRGDGRRGSDSGNVDASVVQLSMPLAGPHAGRQRRKSPQTNRHITPCNGGLGGRHVRTALGLQHLGVHYEQRWGRKGITRRSRKIRA
jgi:hypothetical protein